MSLTRRQFYQALGDILAILSSIWLAFHIRIPDAPEMARGLVGIFDRRTGASALTIAVYFFSLYVLNNYDNKRDWRRIRTYGTILLASLISFGILSAAFYAAPFWRYGRGVLSVQLGLATLGVCLVRYAVDLSFRKIPSPRRLLVLGTGPAAETLGEEVSGNPHYDHLVVGFVGNPTDAQRGSLSSAPIHEYPTSLATMARQSGADEIVLALENGKLSEPTMIRDVLSCKVEGLPVSDMPVVYKRLTGKVPITHVNEHWFIFGRGFDTPTRPVLRNSLRLFDVLVSATGLVLTLPLCVFIGLFIKLTSPGSIFYTQTRLGEKKRPFQIIKFRTMRPDAERNGPEWSHGVADSRVTPVGRFLRRTRLDELPQLLNIVKGEMSLIGPRPERPEFVEHLAQQIPFYDLRFAVRPGLTGWAQVNYKYGASDEEAAEKLQYELYYIQENSLGLNARILLKTIPTVLFTRGS